MLVVFGGTIGATLVCFPMKTVLGVMGVMRKTFFFKGLSNGEIIKTLEELAKKARKEGLLSLQAAGADIDDDFYKAGLQLVVDGQEADTIEAILATEIEYIGARHNVGAELFKAMGTYAPAFGMIGTVIGLIQMLQSMSDPSSIGPAMAVALITTFYGALLANVVFLPLATKLQARSAEELEQKNLLMEGLLSIHAGDNPRILVQKLSAFVPPSAREKEAA
jgi:chemotaxis protein MotA